LNTKHCLASESFHKIIDSDASGAYLINEGENKPNIYLINDNLAQNARVIWLSDAQNPTFCAI
jgi:hypothetical protein